MSADNWRVCPRCVAKKAATQIDLKLEASRAYGRVAHAEYLEMLKRADEPVPGLPETFREDFEIGTDQQGKFYVDYGGSCSECNFEVRFKHESNSLQELPQTNLAALARG